MAKPIFNRRHYEALANWWLEYHYSFDHVIAEDLYDAFKDMLKRDNPNFKESIFDKASGFTN